MTYEDYSEKLLTMKQTCRRYNLSPTTLRRLHARDAIKVLVLPSGHRRFSPTSLDSLMDKKSESGAAEKSRSGASSRIPILAVIRVSGKRQTKRTGKSDSSSLESQRKRLNAFIGKKWGHRNVNIVWYSRVASGLALNHPVFTALISDLIAGKASGGFLVSENASRVARFASDLVTHIADLANTKIVYSLTAIDRSTSEEIIESLLNIMNFYTGKSNGAKARQIIQVNIKPEYLKFADKLSAEGLSLRSILIEFDKRKWRSEKDTKIGVTVLRLRLKSWREEQRLAGITPEIDKISKSNSFYRFINRYVRKASGDVTVSRARMLQTYERYVRDIGGYRISDAKCDQIMSAQGWKRSRPDDKVIYHGVAVTYSSKTRKGGAAKS